MSDRLIKFISLAGTTLLLGLTLFLAGVAVGAFKWWPYPGLAQSFSALKSLVEHGAIAPEGQLVRAPAGASRTTWTLHRPARQQAGYYLLVGYEQALGQYSARLFSQDGERLHRWPIDSTGLGDTASTPQPEAPHPVAPLPDGSIIVGFDQGGGMARLDACGRPLWVKPGYFHHSLDQADDGSWWTWRGAGGPYVTFQYLHNFDADTGRAIREIGLVEDIIPAMGPAAQVFGVRPGALGAIPGRGNKKRDIFHPNDLEVLSAGRAGDFSLFEAGDLMISLRSLHLVAVLDPATYRVKWWSRGPWLFQHDPDFLPGGLISVYSNNTDRGRSEIIQVDPVTGRLDYPLFGGEARFYSKFMGKHQYLPNGNVLVVVPGEGRVLELTDAGDLVLEFNNLTARAAFNAHVEHGFWLPRDFYAQAPACP